MALSGIQTISPEFEEAIRFALVCIEKRAVLMDEMAKQAQTGGRHRSVVDFTARAKLCRQHAEILRQTMDGPAGASSQGSAP